jgi:hypothetical protein
MPKEIRKRISLYGDSLSLPREGIVLNGERHIIRLQDHLRERYDYGVDVLDRGEGAVTITNLKSRIAHDNRYYREAGFFSLIQSGIVDCAPRPVTDSMRERIGKLPSFIRKRIIRYLHNHRTHLISRRFFVRTSLKDFRSHYLDSVKMLGEFHEHVFCVNICPALAEFEKIAPGISIQINRYNQVIEEASGLLSTRSHLINVHKMISQSTNGYDYILQEDHHHITSLTHEWIANQILQKIEQAATHISVTIS